MVNFCSSIEITKPDETVNGCRSIHFKFTCCPRFCYFLGSMKALPDTAFGSSGHFVPKSEARDENFQIWFLSPVGTVLHLSLSRNNDLKKAALAFIYKRLRLNLGKLTEEERTFLKKIAQKSDLLKNSNIQRAGGNRSSER